MALSILNLWKKERLTSFGRWSALDLCANLDNPGAPIDAPTHLDFTERRTTRDQLAIEAVLSEMDLSAARLLHVGVGDSGLAKRFSSRCRHIDGITVSQNELDMAQATGIPNYRSFLINKYHRDFLRLEPGYDVIVDNNLASFVCCLYHLAQMFEHYRWALKPGGRILTDQRGMDWVVRDRRWRMTADDLNHAGARFGFTATRLTETVFALMRNSSSPK